MKITFILPGIGIAGGVKSTFELATRLQSKGHEVSVVYPLIPMRSGAKWYNLRKIVGRCIGTIINLKNGNHLEWFDLKANLIRVPTLAERYIPKGDIIVATWWANAYDVNSYGTDKGEKIYFIRHYETWGGPEYLVNKTYTLPLHKIVISTWLKTLIEKKFNVSTYGPLLNGIDSDIFYQEKPNYECHNPVRIGMLYRRTEWKGMKDGLNAIIKVKKQHSNIELILFGEKPTSDDMKIIEKIGDFEFYKSPYQDYLREIYNSLDIFVFPSHCEGFGNPPMEAMICGVACVTTNVGGIPDYAIPEKTALISSPKDSESLAENIIQLLEDENKRKSIAENGHNYVEQFTWDKTAHDLENIFNKYIEG